MQSLKHRPIFVISLLWFLATIVGCNKPTPVREGQKPQLTDGDQKSVPSYSALLETGDYAYFKPGRLMAEVLADVQWRGDFEFSTDCEGHATTAISYGIYGGHLSRKGISVLALFIDGAFA
jgi:hypothetical protein